MELPISFLENMKQLLSEDEYQAYLDSYQEERVYGLRVNTLKITPEEFEKIAPFPIKRIPWITNGYYYDGAYKPAKDPYYFAGMYYLQEPSAMTPAHILPIEPGDRVLDLCAAPGGKSTELAAKLKGKGLLVSNDISNSRAKALLKNLELFGAGNILLANEAPHKLAANFEGFFDKILIDAPCSGEGMFRKDQSVIRSWQEHGNEFYVKIQKEITASALKMLRPGGMLLYSTCTFSPLEDEQIITHMLELDPSLSLVEPEWYEGFDHGHPEWSDGNEELRKCVRIWPHRMKGEGHFLALLKKSEADQTEYAAASFIQKADPVNKKTKPAKQTFEEKAYKGLAKKADRKKEEPQADPFEMIKEQIKGDWDWSYVESRQEKAYLMPEVAFNQRGLRIMRCGLLLGEGKKNRFEPSQALAMALKAEQFENRVNLTHDDLRTIKYLKGETIEAEPTIGDGWVLVCVDNQPLGFGKASGKTIKNKYLAGWRWM